MPAFFFQVLFNHYPSINQYIFYYRLFSKAIKHFNTHTHTYTLLYCYIVKLWHEILLCVIEPNICVTGREREKKSNLHHVASITNYPSNHHKSPFSVFGQTTSSILTNPTSQPPQHTVYTWIVSDYWPYVSLIH